MTERACPYLRGLRRAQRLLILALATVAGVTVLLPLPVWASPVAVLACLVVFILVMRRFALEPMQHCRNEQMERQLTTDILCRQAEMDALQSQINPHFLYNTLDSIRGQALAEGAEDIADMTEALSTFFRYSISNSNNVATLAEELENVRNYFMIQQFRFSNRFHLEICPFPQELLEECRMPKLTLQPILENCILHGMEQVMGQGTITIRVEATDLRTILTVSDNGAGMQEEVLLRLQSRLRQDTKDPQTETKRFGIALPNVNRRIQLLFGKEYGLRVMSTLGQGTDVEICLPPSKGVGNEA